MLPFEPESIEELKARYTDAIQEVFNPIEVAEDPDLSPGKRRKHVFDFEDGLRLIVSVDQLDSSAFPRVTHYSASLVEYLCDINQFEKPIDYVEFVVERINKIRPRAMFGKVVTKIDKGVLHVYYDENQMPIMLDESVVVPKNPRMN